MCETTSILDDAALDLVSGGGKLGDAAQQLSGLFKAASDIGHGSTHDTVVTVAGAVGDAALGAGSPS